MLNILFLLAPIFLLLILGKVIKKTLVTDEQSWFSINKITYFVLFPAFTFNKTSTMDFGNIALLDYTVVLIIGFFSAVFISYLIGKIVNIDPPSLTSIIQGAGRHNSFIALAVSAQLLGEKGIILGTITIAILVPFSNIFMVSVMSSMLHKNTGKKINILNQLLSNPIIISIFFGLLINYIGWGKDPILYEITKILAGATLPVVLLCIGASLQFSSFKGQLTFCLLSSFSKMIVFPAVVYFTATMLSLPLNFIIVAMIFAISPTSPAGYPLAQQMGGNAPLIAAIISLQTAVSILVLPLMIMLIQG
ncbi:putative membrane protein [Moritella sp. JT01]|uniref:AEC family transporter n=1 Tax=Moritella sp. JT01 TaxID=756698 RepID=UPI000796D0F6|nr:AEC family transporter [Moritella sp. JT01]KXO12718.1 putative membrane protein [Moritella sp. JT01]